MKTAKLFQNGSSQAVRLPQEFRLPGNQVYIKKIDNTVVLIPIENPWEPLINSLDKFSPDFLGNRDQPDNQDRDYF